APQPQRLALPHRGDRVLAAIQVDEHALGPSRLPFVMQLVRTKDVCDCLENTCDEGVRVLREHHAATEALHAQLMGEVRKVTRTRQVDDCVGGEAMTVTAADDGNAEAPCQREDATVFRPGAITVQFERVDPIPVSTQECQERRIVMQLTDPGKIPTWVIED